MSTPAALAAFCAAFNEIDKTCTNRVQEIYTEDVVFCDPLHRIEGRVALERYFAALYARVSACRFVFHAQLLEEQRACVSWTLHLTHPRLNGGRELTVEGCSWLTFAADGQRVCHHRDYFDVGALLYERLPLLGPTVRWIQRQAGH